MLKLSSTMCTPPNPSPPLISSCVLLGSPNDDSNSDMGTPKLRRSTRHRRPTSAMLISNSATSDGEDAFSPLRDTSPLLSHKYRNNSPTTPPSRWHAKFRKSLSEIAWEETNRIRFETKGFYGKKLQTHTPLVSRNLTMLPHCGNDVDTALEATPRNDGVARQTVRQIKKRVVQSAPSKVTKKLIKHKHSKIHEWKICSTEQKEKAAASIVVKTPPKKTRRFFSSSPKSPSRCPTTKLMIGNHRVHIMPAKVSKPASCRSSPRFTEKCTAADKISKEATDAAENTSEENANENNEECCENVCESDKQDSVQSDDKESPSTSSKWFSLFDKQTKDSTQRSDKSNAKLPSPKNIYSRLRGPKAKDSDNMQQLVIDVGQKEVATVQCKECKMLYTPCDEEDSRTHKFFHNSLFIKLRFPGWKKENVIQQYRDGRVICIRPSDPRYAIQKATEVKQVIDNELGYATEDMQLSATSTSQTFFLFISDEKMVVGCLAAEEVSQAYRVIPNETVNCCETLPVKVMCGVNRLWTLRSHRRRKIASHLMDCLRSTFIYGHVLEIDEIAFSSPSPSGELFASSYAGERYLVYK